MAIATGKAIAIAWVRQPGGPRLTLYAETLTLTPDCLPQIAKLGFHSIGNSLARRVHGIAELFADGFHWHAVPQLASTLRRPFRAAPPSLVRPPRCADRGATCRPGNWREGSPAARAAAEHQRRTCANHGAQHRRGQQIVLLITTARSAAV